MSEICRENESLMLPLAQTCLKKQQIGQVNDARFTARTTAERRSRHGQYHRRGAFLGSPGNGQCDLADFVFETHAPHANFSFSQSKVLVNT